MSYSGYHGQTAASTHFMPQTSINHTMISYGDRDEKLCQGQAEDCKLQVITAMMRASFSYLVEVNGGL